jgi:hypothetical protein
MVLVERSAARRSDDTDISEHHLQTTSQRNELVIVSSVGVTARGT